MTVDFCIWRSTVLMMLWSALGLWLGKRAMSISTSALSIGSFDLVECSKNALEIAVFATLICLWSYRTVIFRGLFDISYVK